MKQSKRYANEKILVLGLARSGVAAAKLLHELGAFVTVNDAKKLEDNKEAQELLEAGITVITDGHPLDLLDEGFSLIVKNPGIPYTNPILEKAIKKEIPIITEVELAYQVSEAPFIGITGTNGKTTTTTMIKQIFDTYQPNKALLAGNIGFPTSDVVLKATEDNVLVTELSSFQLMGIDEFKPEIAVITNIYEAHIDYHGSRDEYVKAKWRIQKNMTENNTLILNADLPEVVELSKQSKATVIYFSVSKKVNGAYLENDWLMYQDEKIMKSTELGVPGLHNVENALAAICVAKVSGVDNESIKKSLSLFSGVPHRTEYIGTYNEIKVYNDSKATNILAAKKAISGFDNEQLVLIAGGLDRGNSFDEFIPAIEQLKAIVLLGETKDKLKEAAKKAQVSEIICVDNMKKAVTEALRVAQPEDTILLSPACASWDMYPNFETRGEEFVAEITKQVGK
ncbi:UDP-N-acetylmuramoyl-L-alanine--D-glutamate ligase [Vagococcus luciliae]|uniref:UDP-N-acetylmuramoylalanine--D-glutamate ligase n=1 Tax=Vagococcus luciliae TaxID=2920380 RepID=A0ABY5NWH5_9ENTE|nr:UDP-N-acetylmuramoyl-L-alanine--D-glutamate ligase [Vagococcus luciliae]UUV97953.1 UDP-N-acetylmuramoylalanine--D-glutamate ligase [Vagococcus luciliae]